MASWLQYARAAMQCEWLNVQFRSRLRLEGIHYALLRTTSRAPHRRTSTYNSIRWDIFEYLYYLIILLQCITNIKLYGKKQPPILLCSYGYLRSRNARPPPPVFVWLIQIYEDLSLGNHRLLIIRCRRMFNDVCNDVCNDVKQYPVYEVDFRNVLLKDETVNYWGQCCHGCMYANVRLLQVAMVLLFVTLVACWR